MAAIYIVSTSTAEGISVAGAGYPIVFDCVAGSADLACVEVAASYTGRVNSLTLASN